MRKQKHAALRRVSTVLIGLIISLAVIGLLVWATWGREIPVLAPNGVIAEYQYALIMITVGLGFFVVIPVFILLFAIAWKYRESNTTAQYEPELHGNRKLEAVWWGIPLAIIVLLAVITWISTHALDPYRKLESGVTPVEVQVVSLEWKWLFIYPDDGIATLNYLNIPKDTPINLTLTSDAPMNAFWVPALAGQIYTMTGMSTQLHIMSDTVGTYTGASTNISGEGYADMYFHTYVMNETDFELWTRDAAASPDLLTAERYEELAEPSVIEAEKTFSITDTSLYNDIVMKYMHMPDDTKKNETQDMHHMHHEGMDESVNHSMHRGAH